MNGYIRMVDVMKCNSPKLNIVVKSYSCYFCNIDQYNAFYLVFCMTFPLLFVFYNVINNISRGMSDT